MFSNMQPHRNQLAILLTSHLVGEERRKINIQAKKGLADLRR